MLLFRFGHKFKSVITFHFDHTKYFSIISMETEGLSQCIQIDDMYFLDINKLISSVLILTNVRVTLSHFDYAWYLLVFVGVERQEGITIMHPIILHTYSI